MSNSSDKSKKLNRAPTPPQGGTYRQKELSQIRNSLQQQQQKVYYKQCEQQQVYYQQCEPQHQQVYLQQSEQQPRTISSLSLTSSNDPYSKGTFIVQDRNAGGSGTYVVQDGQTYLVQEPTRNGAYIVQDPSGKGTVVVQDQQSNGRAEDPYAKGRFLIQDSQTNGTYLVDDPYSTGKFVVQENQTNGSSSFLVDDPYSSGRFAVNDPQGNVPFLVDDPYSQGKFVVKDPQTNGTFFVDDPYSSGKFVIQDHQTNGQYMVEERKISRAQEPQNHGTFIVQDLVQKLVNMGYDEESAIRAVSLGAGKEIERTLQELHRQIEGVHRSNTLAEGNNRSDDIVAPALPPRYAYKEPPRIPTPNAELYMSTLPRDRPQLPPPRNAHHPPPSPPKGQTPPPVPPHGAQNGLPILLKRMSPVPVLPKRTNGTLPQHRGTSIYPPIIVNNSKEAQQHVVQQMQTIYQDDLYEQIEPPLTIPTGQLPILLRRMSPVPSLPSRSQGVAISSTSQPGRGTSPVSRVPIIVSNSMEIQQQVAQKMQVLSLYPGDLNGQVEPPPPYPMGSAAQTMSTPLPSYSQTLAMRQSPTPNATLRRTPLHMASSLCSSPIPACASPVSSLLSGSSGRTYSPTFMQSAKSTQVQKPQMQTATPCAPARIVVGRSPVSRLTTVEVAGDITDVSSETTPPPSYAASFQQRQQTPDSNQPSEPSLPSYAASFQQRQQTLDSNPSPAPALPSYACSM